MLMYAVDSDPLSRVMLASLFGAEFEVESFASAEACLAAVHGRRPDLVLADIELPGMGGIEMCRRLKEGPNTESIPVVLLSRDDGLECRLLAYDAGGEDFVAKPYAVDELKRRVLVIGDGLRKSAALRGQMADSELLASLLMSNMDEYAVLLKFTRAVNECADEEGTAEALLALLAGFGLDGAVEVRLPWKGFTLSRRGRDWHLEKSIMSHLRKLGRIFQFRRRCAYNYERVTVLVNDMPWEDAETCGRLRDHLAIAAEMADARLHAILLAQRDSRTRNDIGRLREELRDTIDHYVEQYDSARRQGAIMTSELSDELAVAFSHLGLSRELEEDIEKIVRQKTERLIAIFDTGDQSMATLAALGERLETLLD